MKLKPYPTQVCFACGKKYGKASGVSTVSPGVCEVCQKMKDVTQPRDFGYPTFPGHKRP